MVADGYTAVPATWTTAGHGMADASNKLESAVNELRDELGKVGECWGHDEIGRAFFNGDDKTPGFGTSRDTLLDELADMVNVVRATGGLLKVSGQNYAVAEEASTIGSALPPEADKDALAVDRPYSLPEVAKGLAKSDPPPSGFDFIISLLRTLVIGCEWPDGEMAGLTSMRDAFHTAAASVNAVADEVSGHTETVTANNEGEAAQQFATFAAALQGGGDEGGLRWLAAACQALGDSTDFLIKQKNAARLQFWLSLAFLGTVWGLALSISWLTGGGSVGAATAATEAEGNALRIFLQNIAETVSRSLVGRSLILRGATMGAVYSGGLDAIGQGARILDGVQDHFSYTELAKAGGEGALAGGLMGGAGAWVGRRGNPFTTALSSYMESGRLSGLAQFAFNGVTGTAGNVASQAVFEQHVDLEQAAEFGVGMAGIEAFKGAGRYAYRQARGGRPPTAGSADPMAPSTDLSAGSAHPGDPSHPATTGSEGNNPTSHSGKDDDGPPPPPPPPPGGAAAPPAGHGTLLAGTDAPRDVGAGTGHGAAHVPGSHEPTVPSGPPARTETEAAPVVVNATGDRPAGPVDPNTGRPGIADVLAGKATPAEGRPEPGGRPPVEEHAPPTTGRVPDRPAPPSERPAPGGPENAPITGHVPEGGPAPAENIRPGGGVHLASGDVPPGGHPSGDRAPSTAHGGAEPGIPPQVAARPGEGGRPAAVPPHGEAADPGPGPGTVAPEDAAPGHPHAKTEGPSIAVVPDPHAKPAGPSRIQRILDGTAESPSHTAPQDTSAAPSEPPGQTVSPPPPAQAPPSVVDRPFLEDMLHRAGYPDLSPTPEVPPHVLRDLRVPPRSYNGMPPNAVDPGRLAGDLRNALHSRTVEGCDVLARLHELDRNGTSARKVNEAYRQATGHDLWSDIERARSEGRLDFDPTPYFRHLLPDPQTAIRQAQEAAYTHVGDPQFARDLHSAITYGDGPRISELLSRAGRRPDEIWRLDDNYRAHYGADPIDHIRSRFPHSSEGEYLAHLLGDSHLETHVISVSEAHDLYGRLSTATFKTAEGGEAQIPFGHPEDGCYDRAHRMAKQLSEWGHSSRKVFAIRGHPGSALRVQAETAGGAAWGSPRDITWNYHVAPVVQVRHPSGHVVEVVMDPSLRRGPLGVDEWVGLMGVSRNDYLRFDTEGALHPEVGKIIDDLGWQRAYNETALVFTTPRETYWAPDHVQTFRDAETSSAANQGNIEGYARVSEARELGNRIRYGAHTNGPAGSERVVNEVMYAVLNDPAFRMLLADVRSGRPWPQEALSVAGAENMGLRAHIAKRAYDMLTSLGTPQVPPPPPQP